MMLNMKKVSVFFTLVFLLISLMGLAAQDRGLSLKVRELAGEYAAVGKQHAVLIDYR